jgi:uncharacterized membrane protein YjjP (DUF1212 family)
MSHLCHRADTGALTASQVRAELARIQGNEPAHGVVQSVLAAGIGCAAFCRIFGGDGPSFAATLVAATVASAVRNVGLRRGYDALLVTSLTAFVAACIVATVLAGRSSEAALAASIVMLVPGNAAIAAVEDLIKGHVIVGLSRAASATLVLVFATLGLLAAMRLTATRR